MNGQREDDLRIWSAVFHDCLRMEIHWLEQDREDPAMYDYQISLLEKSDPIRFASRIKALKGTMAKVSRRWTKNQSKIKQMEEELAVYERNLQCFEQAKNKS